jgi:hypothetical protein
MGSASENAGVAVTARHAADRESKPESKLIATLVFGSIMSGYSDDDP